MRSVLDLSQFHQFAVFQRLLKADNLIKAVESQAAAALRLLLEQVPAIRLLDIEHEALSPYHGVDIVAHFEVYGRRQALAAK